jgi:hypothetical protein
MIINLLVTNKKHTYEKEGKCLLFFTLYILKSSHTTSYYYNESLFPTDMLFFGFAYSLIGYDKTINDAKKQESAGIKMIVYRMKSF